jgi:hypothetical protein
MCTLAPPRCTAHKRSRRLRLVYGNNLFSILSEWHTDETVTKTENQHCYLQWDQRQAACPAARGSR